MHDYLEMEYEDIVEELYEPSDEELFEDYYLIEDEKYSYAPDWSNQNYYVEYWEAQ
jgi:hypothetical protein